MLIPYNALLQLPKETLANLIREYLLGQVEDGSFTSLDEQELSAAIAQCQQALKQGKLVLEYSEDDESFAIRHADQVAKRQD
ncbi:MAG: YheU family protein [Shewanella sp.]